MKLFFMALIILFSNQIHAQDLLGATTGLELGMAKIRKGHDYYSGPSWAYHFELDVDKYLNFFGQAGQSTVKKESDNLTINSFTGGIGMDLIPMVETRIGFALTQLDHKQEVGPLVGVNIKIDTGTFIFGPSVTYTKTDSLDSTSLRFMLLMKL